jgi:hypothetical protein
MKELCCKGGFLGRLSTSGGAKFCGMDVTKAEGLQQLGENVSETGKTPFSYSLSTFVWNAQKS